MTVDTTNFSQGVLSDALEGVGHTPLVNLQNLAREEGLACNLSESRVFSLCVLKDEAVLRGGLEQADETQEVEGREERARSIPPPFSAFTRVQSAEESSPTPLRPLPRSLVDLRRLLVDHALSKPSPSSTHHPR
jgi:hypothetical protein